MSILTVLGLLGISLAAVLCTPVSEQDVGPPRRPCPYFWEQFEDRCYKYVSALKDWPDALTECERDGASLVSVHNLEEFSFLQNFIRHHDSSEGLTWIGLHDLFKEGQWRRTDGSKFDFKRWGSGMPNGGTDQNCVLTNWEKTDWNDYPCGTLSPFVCAIRAVGP